MKTTILLIVTGILCSLNSNSEDLQYSFREEYIAKCPTKLTVSSSDGNIDVISSEGNTVKVFYSIERNNKPISMSKEDLHKEGIVVEVLHENEGLDIYVKYPRDYFLFNVLNRVIVNLEILVPKVTRCDLKASDGNISIQGLIAEQKCTTSDGNINISGITGSILMKTSDGIVNISNTTGDIKIIGSDALITCDDILGNLNIRSSDRRVKLNNVCGEVKCITSDGKIELADSKGDFNIKNSDGGVSFTNISGSMQIITSDGGVKGDMVELGDNLNVKTSDGKIDITVPDALGLDLNIRGGICVVPSNNFSGESKKTSICGKVNGGGIPITLSTNDGRIILAYR